MRRPSLFTTMWRGAIDVREGFFLFYTLIETGSPRARHGEQQLIEQASSNRRMDEDYDKGEYEQFDDYLEMIVQLGYVTLFAGAFPLAAPLSVICNILELYSDIFKLSFITRRPKVHRVTNIGVLYKALSSCPSSQISDISLFHHNLHTSLFA